MSSTTDDGYSGVSDVESGPDPRENRRGANISNIRDLDSSASDYSDHAPRSRSNRKASPYLSVDYRPRYKRGIWWVGMIPVGFVLCIVAYCYFITMYVVILPLILRLPILGLIELVAFHTALGLLLTSFGKTVLCSPGYVEPGYLAKVESRESVSDSQSLAAKWADDVRLCAKCDDGKPERAHHCRMCKRCILKMDHHCPWVNNCVGFRNYKYFVLFLMYVPVTGFTLILCAIPHITNLTFETAMTHWNVQVWAVMLIAGVFGLGLAGFSAMHITLSLKNTTTLESIAIEDMKWQMRRRAKRTGYIVEMPVLHPYDLGVKRRNFEQVFGTNPWLWFLPTYTTVGDGEDFPRGPTPRVEHTSQTIGDASRVARQEGNKKRSRRHRGRGYREKDKERERDRGRGRERDRDSSEDEEEEIQRGRYSDDSSDDEEFDCMPDSREEKSPARIRKSRERSRERRREGEMERGEGVSEELHEARSQLDAMVSPHVNTARADLIL